MKCILAMLLLISAPAFSNEGGLYCFGSEVDINRVKKHVEQILLRNEGIKTIVQNGRNCLEIKKVLASEDIIKKFIEKKFVIAKYESYNSQAAPLKNSLSSSCRVLIQSPEQNSKKKTWLYLSQQESKKITLNSVAINLSCSANQNKINLTFKNGSREISYHPKNRETFSLKEIIKELTGKEMPETRETSMSVTIL